MDFIQKFASFVKEHPFINFFAIEGTSFAEPAAIKGAAGIAAIQQAVGLILLIVQLVKKGMGGMKK
jgi:hypothetical protein